MADVKFTAAQQKAISSHGSSILVSAAAGSGKTSVLTKRLMAYITDSKNPVDIDKFLVITYTRAAAAELRSRILTDIIERGANEPNNKRLRRQKNLCYRAQIGTIHSFCATILRENAHQLGLSTDFKVAEEDRIQQILLRSLEQVLDKTYEDADPEFLNLSNTIGQGRDDRRLEETILNIYSKIQSQKSPEQWIESQIRECQTDNPKDVSQTIWGEYYLSDIQNKLRYWANEMESLLELLNENRGYADINACYGESIEETALNLRDAERACSDSWDKAKEWFPIKFPKLKTLRKPEFPMVAEQVKDRRKACDAEMKKLAIVFENDSETIFADIRKMVPVTIKLLEIILELDHVFKAEKKRQNIVDFSDLEHMTAELLTDENDKPTELAREISSRFTEIMVDEYQDVNQAQEVIITALSKDEKNLFVVGDVKQSIYRFRLADPQIFLRRDGEYSEAEKQGEKDKQRILLSENFRSRNCIVESVNHIFKNIMSPQIGELEYDYEAELKWGATYYDMAHEKNAELMLVELPSDDEDDDPDKAKIEACAVAKKIKSLVQSGEMVQGKEGMRPVKYSDFAVLIRSLNTVRSSFAAGFAEIGVPLSDGRGESFFKSPEVSAMVAMLAVIDNPHQDIPLIAVLRSSFFGFTPDELAEIRNANKNGSFYEALVLSSENSEKCANFLEKLTNFRQIAGDLPTDELIARLYNEMDAMMLMSAMEGSEQKIQNLMQLMEYGKKFESDGYRGVFKFVALLRRMIERGDEPDMQSSDLADAVTIMSIHKSKGLEFPYVFVSSTGRKFNKSDLNNTVLLHTSFGIASNIIDSEKNVEYPSIAKRAIYTKLNAELLSEEMRVLYVALTRAKERLFISCAMKDPEGYLEKIAYRKLSPIPTKEISSAQFMSQWLIRAAVLDDSNIDISVVGLDEQLEEAVDGKYEEIPAKQELVDMITERVEFIYPHEKCTDIPSKLTATQLKYEAKTAGFEDKSDNKGRDIFALPELGLERKLTGAEIGTATHVVMQYIDFSKTSTIDEIEGEIARLHTEGYINERQAEAVEPIHIKAFFDSELGERLEKADEVYRELPFSLLCYASDYYDVKTGDEILLQGIIDCCMVEDGKITIIDYKTDYVNQNKLPKLVENYSIQVQAYARAMARIMQKEVGEIVLFFLRGNIGAVIDSEGKLIRILG